LPAENILILNTEKVQENLVKSLAEVMEFVGLHPLEDTTSDFWKETGG